MCLLRKETIVWTSIHLFSKAKAGQNLLFFSFSNLPSFWTGCWLPSGQSFPPSLWPISLLGLCRRHVPFSWWNWKIVDAVQLWFLEAMKIKQTSLKRTLLSLLLLLLQWRGYLSRHCRMSTTIQTQSHKQFLECLVDHNNCIATYITAGMLQPPSVFWCLYFTACFWMLRLNDFTYFRQQSS